jgi:1,2-diacylglycerol 3-alpha-glucosyltransferase
MRIAIFSDNFYPELSGISDSIIALSKQLAARGHRIAFYAPKYVHANYRSANLPFKELDLGENIQIHRFVSFPFKTGTGQGRFVIPDGLRAISISKFRPDVIHTQLFFGVGLEALFASRILRKPLVGTNHTALKEFLKYSPIKAGWFNKGLLNYVNWYYGQCDFVTAPSQSVFDEMVALGFKNPHTKAMSNPIDTVMFTPMPGRTAELKKKFGFTDATLISAGRLADEKNNDVLIRALAHIKKAVPNAMLALAGKGSSEEKLRALAKELGIGDSVKFLGLLDKPTLAEAFKASEIFAVASKSDTQNMGMMQAMACGLPVIGVRARGLPEYIHAENGFVVEPDDDKAFAEKAVQILTNKNNAATLAKGARNYVEQFSEPAIATKWEEIYAGAIKSYNERNKR